MNIIPKNTTLNGTPTIVIKTCIKTVIVGLQGLIKLVESYERGEITEDECLTKGDNHIKQLETELDKPEFKFLESDE